MSTAVTKTPTRRRQPKEFRVQQIIDCAEEVFDERGFETATVAEIARRAGVVEGTVFRYFETKYELVLEVTTRWYAVLFEELVTGLKGISGTRNRLRYIIWSQLEAANERAELTGAIILAARGHDEQFTRQVSDLYQQYTRPLYETLEKGEALGELRTGISHRLVANMLYGGIEQCIWQMLETGEKTDVETVADELVELIFAGIAQPQPADTGPRADKLLDRLEQILENQAPA